MPYRLAFACHDALLGRLAAFMLCALATWLVLVTTRITTTRSIVDVAVNVRAAATFALLFVAARRVTLLVALAVTATVSLALTAAIPLAVTRLLTRLLVTRLLAGLLITRLLAGLLITRLLAGLLVARLIAELLVAARLVTELLVARLLLAWLLLHVTLLICPHLAVEIVFVLEAVLVALPIVVIFFEARTRFGEHTEIVIGELQVIFGVDAVTLHLRVARQRLVFFVQLRGVSARAVVDAIARLRTPRIAARTLPAATATTTATAATATVLLLPIIVDQLSRSSFRKTVRGAPFGRLDACRLRRTDHRCACHARPTDAALT